MTAERLLVSLLLACKDDGTQPPPIPERINLTLIDVAVRKVYVHIAITNPSSNESVVLQRNGTVITVSSRLANCRSDLSSAVTNQLATGVKVAGAES